MPERLERTRRARQLQGIIGDRGHSSDPAEYGRSVGAAQHLQQQTELECGRARRRALRDRSKRGFGLLIATPRHERARLDRRDVRLLRVELLRERRNLVVAALDERAYRQLETGGRTARGLRDDDRDEREQDEKRDETEGVQAAG